MNQYEGFLFGNPKLEPSPYLTKDSVFDNGNYDLAFQDEESIDESPQNTNNNISNDLSNSNNTNTLTKNHKFQLLNTKSIVYN